MASVKTKGKRGVTLTLNSDQASALAKLLENVGGSNETRRKLTDQIGEMLEGVDPGDRDTQGSIYFVLPAPPKPKPCSKCGK